VFSFALMFANDCLTACDGFYDASACWLSHMKQWTIDHWPLERLLLDWRYKCAGSGVQY